MAARSTLNGRFRDALLTLQAETPGLLGAVLVSSAGLTITSTLPETVETDVVAAMSAPLLALSERTAAELWQGKPAQVMIKGEDGTYVLLEKVNPRVALVALATKEARLGLVFINMAVASAAVARIIQQVLESHPLTPSPRISKTSARKFRRLR